MVVWEFKKKITKSDFEYSVKNKITLYYSCSVWVDKLYKEKKYWLEQKLLNLSVFLTSCHHVKCIDTVYYVFFFINILNSVWNDSFIYVICIYNACRENRQIIFI